MPTIQLGKQELYYAARGNDAHQYRAPLLFIHGAGDSHLLWNGQLAAFANETRALAIDLPGHGRSTGAGRATILEYAKAVREFLDAFKLEGVIAIGNSMGGAIAQMLALEYSERVAGLGLVGTGAKLRVAPAYLQNIASDLENFAPELVKNYYAANAPAALIDQSAAALQATGAQVAYADFAACDVFDVRGRLGEIHAPALIVCGAEDKLTPPSHSEFLAQQIAGAELRLIPKAGHMVMLEQPAAFNQCLRNWLQTHLA